MIDNDIGVARSAESKHNGLPSDDRLRGLDIPDLMILSYITGIPLKDLWEMRELEKGMNEKDAPKPKPWTYYST